MSVIKRIVLDVLKPLHPDVLEFASAITDRHSGCRVRITVTEVDQKTETTVVEINGDDIPYADLLKTISSLGASVHSIDEVEVAGDPEQ
jgi:hypothetical protein